MALGGYHVNDEGCQLSGKSERFRSSSVILSLSQMPKAYPLAPTRIHGLRRKRDSSESPSMLRCPSPQNASPCNPHQGLPSSTMPNTSSFGVYGVTSRFG